MAPRDLTKLEGRVHTAVTSPRRRSRPGRYGRTEWPWFYPSLFATSSGLRPQIRVEMSLLPPTLPPIASLIGAAQGKQPEIAAFLCVDPVETAADKLSALAWRVQARRRDSDGNDPTIVRHVHDLAALKPVIAASGEFTALVNRAMSEDEGRGGAVIAVTPARLLAGMLERLATDPLWATEYCDYVRQVFFAYPAELIGFDQALAALTDLVVLVRRGDPT